MDLRIPVRHVTKLSCAVAIATLLAGAAAYAQRIAVGLSPGPWDFLEGRAGDPIPRTGPVVFVPYDARQRGYVTVRPEQLEVVTTLNADCAGKAGKRSFLEIQIAGQPGALSTSTLGRSKGNFTGTTTGVTKSTVNQFLSALRIPDPVSTCNKDLEAMVATGKHGEAQRGWGRRFERAMPVELKLSCVEKDDEGLVFTDPGDIFETSTKVDFPVWIHCGAAAVAETSRGRGRPPTHTAGVQSVEVWVNPKANANYSGPCPKRLNFGGRIEFAGARGTSGRVRYRYRTHDNATSPIYEVTFDGSGTRNLHFWQREFGGGDPGKTLAAPGGKKPTVIQGFVQLEVLGEGNDVTRTDRAPFKLTCEPRGAPTRIKG